MIIYILITILSKILIDYYVYTFLGYRVYRNSDNQRKKIIVKNIFLRVSDILNLKEQIFILMCDLKLRPPEMRIIFNLS